MTSLVVTLVGPDRPGLVGVVSDVVRNHGGNWLESRMSHLAGQFAGIVLVDAPQDSVAALKEGLAALGDKGLKVVVGQDSADSPSTQAGQMLTMNVVANDRAGIVREVTSVLAALSINVEEFTTECADAPQGGSRIFKAAASICLPEDLQIETLREEMEGLAADLMIDFSD